MKYKVFNIEFDGIDKCGKDSIMKQIFSYCPNKFIPKTRGLMSQIAYAKMFNRNSEYEYSDGYLENTLFVYLTVNEDDWKVRCDITNEHEKNKYRTDVEREIKYKESCECFDYAYEKLYKELKNKKHIMKFNTSEVTPINIIKEVINRINELNIEYLAK